MSQHILETRKKRRPMSEINVVPYIDVMLVLMVIFMITAPLLHQGVEVDLPRTDAAALQPEQQEPVIVRVDRQGNYWLSLAGEPDELIDAQTLQTKVSAFVRANPDIPVLVGGDRKVSYGRVMQVMVALQKAGVPKLGLMSDPGSEDTEED